MPCPMKARTTAKPSPSAWVWMARPMSDRGRPGRTAAMPRASDSAVTRTRVRDRSSTVPTHQVAFVSPWTPSR